MKKAKIIYINSRYYGREFHDENNDFFYLFGVGNVFCYEIKKLYPFIEVENWRADKSVDQDLERTVDGIKCKVFKGNHWNYIGIVSWSLIRVLRQLIESNDYNTLVHFQGLHNISYLLIAWLIPNIPIVATHHGGGNYSFRYKNSRKASNYFARIIDRFSIKKLFDHLIVQTATEYNYLSGFLGTEKVSRITPFGFDLDVFKPEDKFISRKKLNIPVTAKLILSVGRADRLKGVQNVVKLYQNLREKMPDLELLCVDVLSDDLYYEDVKSSGARIIGRVSWYDLPSIYSAADILVYLPLDDESLNFAGPGYITAEALACGIPVVSTLLVHFWDNSIFKVAGVPKSLEEAESLTMQFLKNPPAVEECREVSYKYYNWSYVLSEHFNIYEKLFLKYYEQNINTK